MMVHNSTLKSANQYWEKPIVLFLDAKTWVILETANVPLAPLPCFLLFLKNSYSVLFCSVIAFGYLAVCDTQL